jgi:hypothetical protein
MFDLPPNADKEKLKAEKKLLTDKLVVALRPYIQELVREEGAVSTFRRTPSTFSAASYFDHPSEVLAVFGEEDDRTEYAYRPGGAFYLRLMPISSLQKPIPKGVLWTEMQRSKLYAMWREPSGLFSTNDYGTIVFEPVSNTVPILKASTQLFQNGEIWGIATWLFKDSRLIPGAAFEQTYRQTLRRYVNFMSGNLGITPPYTFIAGATGLENHRIAVEPSGLETYGPFYDDQFENEFVLNGSDQIALDEALLRFFEEFFKLTGYGRPAGLFGFPITK